VIGLSLLASLHSPIAAILPPLPPRGATFLRGRGKKVILAPAVCGY
jgi:hypothetical protein